jgi:hypothetical protein
LEVRLDQVLVVDLEHPEVEVSLPQRVAVRSVHLQLVLEEDSGQQQQRRRRVLDSEELHHQLDSEELLPLVVQHLSVHREDEKIISTLYSDKLIQVDNKLIISLLCFMTVHAVDSSTWLPTC